MSDQLALWNRFNDHYRYYPDVSMGLDISRMRFPEAFLSEMALPVQKAFLAMDALESGTVANPDEKRMVGHYWLRSPELAPTPEIRSQIEAVIKQVEDFAANVVKGSVAPSQGKKFQHLIIAGIGGSALGPQLVSEALGDLYRGTSGLKLAFLDNTDPDGMQRVFRSIDLSTTLVVVISKSGGTVETRNGMLEAEKVFQQAGLDFARHTVVITVPGSNLEKFAQEKKWLQIFHLWDWVGGRNSLFSAVGLLPAALEGIPFREILEGARKMDVLTRSKTAANNPAALLALMWFFAGEGKGKKDMVILPYKDRLVLMSKYLQQLVMESLGKEHDLTGKVVNQGIAVYGNKGSTDQHAYVQQLRDGVNNFFATFIEVLSDFTEGSRPEKLLEVKESITSGDYLHGFLQGTRTALYEKGRDSITITFEKLTPETVGALIALYERAVGFYATLVNVNAYHQPGVEAGKKAAERVVELQHLLLKKGFKGEHTAMAIAEALSVPNEVEVIHKILSHLVPDGRGIGFKRGTCPKEDRFLF